MDPSGRKLFAKASQPGTLAARAPVKSLSKASTIAATMGGEQEEVLGLHLL